jgi:predicted cupin superfamily sugar epimerase
MNSARELIDYLNLEPHPEGGYFKRTYESQISAAVGPNGSDRKLLTCIHYLLTRESPIGCLHVNQSDIIHFFHQGSPITYTLVSPERELNQVILGTNLDEGQQLQLTVPSGWWKASELKSGDYGLISEAVSPGFEYEDMNFIPQSEVQAHVQSDLLSRLCIQ